jgi:hypothetical protein
MKRVLIVSPHFPPVNAPDMQRIRMSLPYYRATGWDPVVLCVRSEDVDAVMEPELMATVPDDVKVVRTTAYPVRWTRKLGVGTLGYRAVRQLYRAGAELLRREHFDLVFFSTTQFMAHILGPLWRRRFGVPYVLDIQDPWRTDYYERKGSRRPPGGWKYQIARMQAWMFEGWTVRNASGLISVSGSYLDDLRSRYPEITMPAEVILFGGSRADTEIARSGPPSPNSYVRRPGEIHLLYTGASGPVMPHSLMVLFEGLRQFREREPERARRLRFHFYGTSYVAPGQGRNSVMPIAEVCRVADMVDEIPHRLGHLECLRLQSEADILLLPGSSDLAYSPSKVYPYYLTGNPILGLVFRDSVMERLLDDLQCATMVRFREAESKVEAYAELQRFFAAAFEGFSPGSLPTRNDAFFNEHYLAESLTGRQAALFNQALEHAAQELRRG